MIRLHSGTLFDPLNPDPKLILIQDIAYGLSGEFRYAAHSRYTVAQHCCLGSDILGGSLPFLLHDASEGLGLRDLPSPVKHAPEMTPYIGFEEKLQNAIGEAFSVSFDDPWIKKVDLRLRRTEQFHLFGRKPTNGEKLFDIEIVPWAPKLAEREFLNRFHLLYNSPNTFSTGEYSRAQGVSRGTALSRLTKLASKGILKRVEISQKQGNRIQSGVMGWQFVESQNVLVGGKSGRGRGFKFEEGEVVEDGSTVSEGGVGGVSGGADPA